MSFKRILALLLSVLMLLSLLSLTGCKDEEKDEVSGEISETEDNPGFIPSNEALTITIPSCAVDAIEENLYAMAASFGITDIRDGADGSLICYIESADKEDVQMAAKNQIYSTMEYYIANTDFILSGEVGYDCDSFTFFCDGSQYIEPADVYLMSYYIPTLTYHALTTPDKDFLFNKKVTFTFLDSETFRQLGEFEFTGQIDDKE